jgi:hypothetical protein
MNQLNINISISRRKYYSDEYDLTSCPECGSGLIQKSFPILLYARSDSDEGEFITNLSGSHFCKKCPVVVFDTYKVEKAAKLGIRAGKNIEYAITGFIDMDSIPENKRHLEMGTEENPIPLIDFLPDLHNQTKTAGKKPGRNDPCLCGSGIKYKKCCGK